MTAKEKLINEIFHLSSGTVATFINSARYCEIDRACVKVMEYIDSEMTDIECESVRTLEDYADLFRKAAAC